MPTTVPLMPTFDRRRSRLRAAFGFIAAEKGNAAAHTRIWIAKAMPLAAFVLAGWAFYSGQVRGNNIAKQVSQNTHALICKGALRPYPPDYQPAYGLPSPATKPCAETPEIAGPAKDEP